jgi:hypothetical protein
MSAGGSREIPRASWKGLRDGFQKVAALLASSGEEAGLAPEAPAPGNCSRHNSMPVVLVSGFSEVPIAKPCRLTFPLQRKRKSQKLRLSRPEQLLLLSLPGSPATEGD